MIKKIFSVFLLVLLSTTLFGLTLEEKSLFDIEKNNFIIDKEEVVCETFLFSLNKMDEKSKQILQINIENFVPVKEGLEINVYNQDELIAILKNTDIKKNNVVEISNAGKSNEMKICVKNNFLPKVIINTSKSKIGSYYLGEIKEQDFYQEAPSKGYVNVPIPINVFVKNSGFDKLHINVISASDLFLFNSNLEIVSGQTEYNGEINPGETIVLNYFVKTDKPINFSTPIAKINYTDDFGVEHNLALKEKFITVNEMENKISVEVDFFEKIQPLKKYYGNLIIINNSEDVLKNILITPVFNGDIILNKSLISEIRAKDVIEIGFEIKMYSEKTEPLSFKITYFDNEHEKISNSEVLNILAKEKHNIDNTAIIILIIITIMLFFWIVKI